MQNKTPEIIAEIGFNHGGDVALAEEMIRAAAQAGADTVKFQTFRPQDLVLPGSEHFDLIKPAELTLDQHKRLAQVAAEAGVAFLSTPFSEWGVEILEATGVARYKVASMDLANTDLLGRLAQTGKPLIVSTGMARLSEIAASVEFLQSEGVKDLTLLHCTSEYPCPAQEVNLEGIPALKRVFPDLRIGFSNHYPGGKACLAAAMYGAEVIETHFTTDRSLPGPDHAISTDPEQMARLVESVKLFASMRGESPFEDGRADRRNSKAWRRGVYAVRDIAPGESVTRDDLICVRPEAEFTTEDLPRIVGRTASRSIKANAPIAWEDLG